VPLAQRAEFAAVTAEPDPRRMFAGYAAAGRVLLERLGPPQRVILEGRRPATRSCAR
jgi:hypothetical protein